MVMEILPNIVDCLNQAADSVLAPFSTLIPANAPEEVKRGRD